MTQICDETLAKYCRCSSEQNVAAGAGTKSAVYDCYDCCDCYDLFLMIPFRQNKLSQDPLDRFSTNFHMVGI